MQRRIFFAFAFVTALAPFFLPGCQAPRPTALTIETRDVMNLCPGQQTICPVAFAHGGAVVSGHVLNDLSGGPAPYGSVRSFGEFGPLFATDSDGNGAVPNARIGAQWQSTVHWNGNCGSNIDPAATASFDVTVENPVIGWGCVPIGIFGKGLGPTFVITNSPPSTMTVPSPTASLTSASGMPELRVYDQSSARVAVMFASSVSTDGTSATFPFPQLSSGLPLPQGFYTFNLWNQTSAGNFKDMGVGFFGVGSSSSATTPYGVDAADVTVSSKTCKITFPSKQIWCTLAGPTTSPSPIVTLSSGGMVSFGGATVAVGSQPTAVKGYATATQTKSTDVYGGYITTTQPSRAMVENFGSNTVSILDLFGKTVVQSISVGTEPAAVVLNSSASKAYVADYGSSSISEIDLTSNTQSRVASVGARPAALAMDPGGTAVWVGGYNYISKVDLTSFSATQTFSVSGQVTSLAVSSGQNALVYTTMATVGGSTTFQAQHVALSTGV